MEDKTKEILLKLYHRKMYIDAACVELGIGKMKLTKLYRKSISGILNEKRKKDIVEAKDDGIVVEDKLEIHKVTNKEYIKHLEEDFNIEDAVEIKSKEDLMKLAGLEADSEPIDTGSETPSEPTDTG